MKEGSDYKQLCHKIVSLWRDDNVPLNAGATEQELSEFEMRFRLTLPPDFAAPLWRKWPDTTPRQKPRYTIELDIAGRRVRRANSNVLQFLEEIKDVSRLRECRVCQRIFWAQRIEKSGGPYGCDTRCNNILRQREYKAAHRRK